MTTWRILLAYALAERNETFADITDITLTASELDSLFDGGFGSAEGKPFTAWTKNNVYFPLEYDGAESVGSVSRNPDGEPTEHQ